jgi:hypothetical protein
MLDLKGILNAGSARENKNISFLPRGDHKA